MGLAAGASQAIAWALLLAEEKIYPWALKVALEDRQPAILPETSEVRVHPPPLEAAPSPQAWLLANLSSAQWAPQGSAHRLVLAQPEADLAPPLAASQQASVALEVALAAHDALVAEVEIAGVRALEAAVA